MKKLLFLSALLLVVAGSAKASPFSGIERAANIIPTGGGSGGGHYIFLGALPQAGGGHSVTLTWNASPDAATNPSLAYNIYRVAASCSSTATFTKINSSPISGLTYTDTNVVTGGTYCYTSTAILNGLESVFSNQAPAVILPAPPSGLAGVAK